MSDIQKSGYIALAAVGFIWFVLGVVAANIAYVCMGLAYVALVFICWSNHNDAIFYQDMYNETVNTAGDFNKIATDAIKNAEDILDSNRKLIKGQEDLLFLINLFLFDIDDEAVDALNEQIKDRGLMIRFYEGRWTLFAKRDE